MINNPFILYGYESEKYFCNRKEETRQLLQSIENGNNVALIAPRRYPNGKVEEPLRTYIQLKSTTAYLPNG